MDFEFYVDACARAIAQAHAGPDKPAISRLAKNGAINPGLTDELTQLQGWLELGDNNQAATQVIWLLAYVELRASRGTQRHWAALPDPTPIRTWTARHYSLALFTRDGDPAQPVVFYRLLDEERPVFAGEWKLAAADRADSDAAVAQILGQFTETADDQSPCSFEERAWRKLNASTLARLVEAFKASMPCPTCQSVGSLEVGDGERVPCARWSSIGVGRPVCGGSGRWDGTTRAADPAAAARVASLQDS